jgi:hypothetical protein
MVTARRAPAACCSIMRSRSRSAMIAGSHAVQLAQPNSAQSAEHVRPG